MVPPLDLPLDRSVPRSDAWLRLPTVVAEGRFGESNGHALALLADRGQFLRPESERRVDRDREKRVALDDRLDASLVRFEPDRVDAVGDAEARGRTRRGRTLPLSGARRAPCASRIGRPKFRSADRALLAAATCHLPRSPTTRVKDARLTSAPESR